MALGGASAPAEQLGEAVESATAPSPESVREHLAAILADAGFQASARRKQLLTYVVEQTLAGNGARLKGFDLAVAVLGRDEHFDPQTDPIIRVEVGKLRRELEHYYLAAGASHPIWIEIPRGRYAPIFHLQHDQPEPVEISAPPSRRWVIGLGLGLAVLLLLAVGLVRLPAPVTPQERGPAIIIADFKASDEAAVPLAIGLTNTLVADLMGFDGLQVFFGLQTGEREAAVPSRLANVPVYIVTGNVDRGADNVRTTARLIDHASGRVIWSRSFVHPLTAADMLTVQDELAADIASRLAQVYGLINHDAGQQINRDRPATLFAYECVQRAFQYRRTLDSALYPAMRGCLEEAVKQDPGYADAWAMLSFSYLDAIRLHRIAPDQAAAELVSALTAAQRGVELAPERVRPLQALAAVRFMSGEFAEAEKIQRRAIALNPNDPETLAQLGWRFAVRGQDREAIQLLGNAIDRSLIVPSWYYATLAIAYFEAGALDLAYKEARRGQDFCCGLGKAILAVMAAEQDHAAEAKAMFDAAIAEAPLLDADPRAFWASWHVREDLISRLNAGLLKARQAIADPQIRSDHSQVLRLDRPQPD